MKYAMLSALLVLMLCLSSCGREPDTSEDDRISHGDMSSPGTAATSGSAEQVPEYSGNMQKMDSTDQSGGPRF
ncbi:MAG: hypothetical protein WCD70_08950 [Alphaproteobacteria bacterium]